MFNQRKIFTFIIMAFVVLMPVIIAITLLSCASITRGTQEALVINTKPAGASVKIKKGEKILFQGLTPTAAKLERKGNYIVLIEKEGYEPLIVNVTNQVSNEGGAGMAGNICLGGCIGAGIDSASGAMLELKPNPINADLEPLKNK